MDYRNDSEFVDFIEYNDLGLPIAYAANSNLIEVLPAGESYISETFELLITSLGLTDTGFESLNEILDSAIE